MIERDLIQQPQPEEIVEEHRYPTEENVKGGIQVPAPAPPQAEGVTGRTTSGLQAVDPMPLPPLESPVLGERIIGAELPGVFPVGAVSSLPMPSQEPLVLESRRLESRVPEISPVIAPGSPLGFPSPLSRPVLKPLKLAQELPQVPQYSFTPSALPLPVHTPVRAVPRQVSQGLAFPVPSRAANRLQEKDGDKPLEADEEEGGKRSAAVGLMEAFFEVQAGIVGSSGLLLGGRPCVVLAEQAPDSERYEGFLLYLLAEVLRCTTGAPRVQIPSRASLEEWTELADRRLTFIPADKRPSDDRLLERLQDLTTSQGAFVVLSGTSDGVEQLANEISSAGLQRVRLCRLSPGKLSKQSFIKVLQSAFGCLPPLVLPGDSLDTVAATLEARFSDKLASYMDKVHPALSRRSPGSNEGVEHYWTKLYVAWLYRDNSVRTEHPLSPHGVADVYVEEGNAYCEIETLYGTGDPVSKLNETVDKYQNQSYSEVHIVIPNFSALLYMAQLLDFERRFLRQRDNRFSIWTLDLSKENAREEAGLRKLRDVAAELRRL